MKKLIGSLFFILTVACPASLRSQTIFFKETFEDAKLDTRGWYDNIVLQLSTAEHIPGSTHSAEFHFLQGARTATSGGGIRHLFAESDEVYLSYWVKYSTNWTGSNKPYHPHDFHFVTNQNDKWVGPAYTHLTTYIEENEGTPLLSIQDGQNVDENHIGDDLTNITENRSLAGCNGNSDGTGVLDCYLNGSQHWNGKVWRSGMKYFSDTPGKNYKNDWHFIEASFKMNDIVGGKGIANGAVMMWYDGELILNEPKVMLRTGQHPDMKFNQFLIAPYIGDGSPIDQTMWVDDLTVASSRPATASAQMSSMSPQELSISTYPNPAIKNITLRYDLPKPSPVEISIYNVLGERLQEISRQEEESGHHESVLDLSSFPTGSYYLTIKACGLTETAVVQLLK